MYVFQIGKMIIYLYWTRILFPAGGSSGEVTPDPIPNSEVKLSCADGTAAKTVEE